MKSLHISYQEIINIYLKIKVSDFTDLEKEILLAGLGHLGNGYERNFERDETFFINRTRNILPKD